MVITETKVTIADLTKGYPYVYGYYEKSIEYVIKNHLCYHLQFWYSEVILFCQLLNLIVLPTMVTGVFF